MLQELEDISFGYSLNEHEQQQTIRMTWSLSLPLFFYCWWISLAIRSVSASTIIHWINRHAVRAELEATDVQSLRYYARLATFILTTSRLGGIPRSCLPLSAVLFLGLRKAGVKATLVLAEIRSSDNEDFLFHAWVEVNRHPINEEQFIYTQCSVITRIGDPRPW